MLRPSLPISPTSSFVVRQSYSNTQLAVILAKLPSLYRILPPYQTLHFTLEIVQAIPFFYQDLQRTYCVRPELPGPPTSTLRFIPHYHPHSQAFINTLARNGVPGLLTLATQKLTRDAVNDPGSLFRTQYGPTTLVHSTYPREDVDFEYGGAYTTYNWELFFHAPLLIADRLSKEQRFEEAQRWFHYI